MKGSVFKMNESLMAVWKGWIDTSPMRLDVVTRVQVCIFALLACLWIVGVTWAGVWAIARACKRAGGAPASANRPQGNQFIPFVEPPSWLAA
jgi:hypothetical protein